MAGPNRSVQAFALSILLIISGPLSQFLLVTESNAELELGDIYSHDSSNYTEVSISGSGNNGIGPSLDLDPNHALQTISFSVAAGDEVRATGFNWSDWDESGFSKLGLNE